MITIASFDNSRVETPLPDWFLAERYEYCERVIDQGRKHKNAFLTALKKIFLK